jgi:hypothetical protein
MTCDNCLNEAVYKINSITRNSVNYCEKHLPADLRVNAALGIYSIPTTEVVEEEEDEDSLDS